MDLGLITRRKESSRRNIGMNLRNASNHQNIASLEGVMAQIQRPAS
jgi:hypothetical protein